MLRKCTICTVIRITMFIMLSVLFVLLFILLKCQPMIASYTFIYNEFYFRRGIDVLRNIRK